MDRPNIPLTSNYRKHTSKNPVRRFGIKLYYRHLIQYVKGLDIKSVLDAGCGEGFTLKQLQKNNIGSAWEGIDNNERAIALCSFIHPDLIVQQASIYSLPYADHAFDLVVCNEVLEHLEQPEVALKELKRVTKRYCLLVVPLEPGYMIGDFTLRKILHLGIGKEVGHIQHWTRHRFEKFVETELQIVSVDMMFAWTFVLAEI